MRIIDNNDNNIIEILGRNSSGKSFVIGAISDYISTFCPDKKIVFVNPSSKIRNCKYIIDNIANSKLENIDKVINNDNIRIQEMIIKPEYSLLSTADSVIKTINGLCKKFDFVFIDDYTISSISDLSKIDVGNCKLIYTNSHRTRDFIKSTIVVNKFRGDLIDSIILSIDNQEQSLSDFYHTSFLSKLRDNKLNELLGVSW